MVLPYRCSRTYSSPRDDEKSSLARESPIKTAVESAAIEISDDESSHIIERTPITADDLTRLPNDDRDSTSAEVLVSCISSPPRRGPGRAPRSDRLQIRRSEGATAVGTSSDHLRSLPFSAKTYRPGGPFLFDLLPHPRAQSDRCTSVPPEDAWLAETQEEEIFEILDVRVDDKVLCALWSRWIMAHRCELPYYVIFF